MATQLLTSNATFQNFYVGYLTADMTATDTDIFIDTPPTGSEGTLIIDPDNATSREIIYYTSRTSTKVTVPSVANGRGYDNTTATTHTTGTKVIMAPIADWFNSLRTLFTTTPQGYTSVGYTPNTVTANGNRSYDLVFNSVNLTGTISPGMRLRTTRTVAAPTQCTSLNGTNQYYSRTSANLGTTMTFTDDFVVSAWVKLSSYAAGGIVSRYNGTSGFYFIVNASGQLSMVGFNAGAANYSRVQSYQSIPLNKWVHVSAQLDMSAFTATTTTSYIMIDGVDVPASVDRGGTNPTTLVQAGNLEIGSYNGGTNPFPGKISQVAIYNAKVTQANIRATISQGLTGSETSLISAYSFNNSINDLNTTNANNLTANGSAVATNADSPFGGQADGTISSTLDYAIVTKASFSTNTTLTVQVPEGCTIPTSGGVSAVSYATVKAPYGMPVGKGKWTIESIYKAASSQASPVNGTWYNMGSVQLSSVPIGEWTVSYQAAVRADRGAAAILDLYTTLSTSSNSESDPNMTYFAQMQSPSGTIELGIMANRFRQYSLSAVTTYYHLTKSGQTAFSLYNGAASSPTIISAENAYL